MSNITFTIQNFDNLSQVQIEFLKFKFKGMLEHIVPTTSLNFIGYAIIFFFVTASTAKSFCRIKVDQKM